MFTKLGRFVVHNPWKVIAAWVIAAIAVLAFAPTLADVTNKDQASFLPDSYESVQAQKLAADAFGQTNDATASIVIKRGDGGALTAADQAKAADLASKIAAAKIDRVTGAVTGPQAVSPNKQVQLISVGLKGLPDDQAVLDAVQHVRDLTGPAVADSGLQYGVTGDAALFLDNQDAFNNAFVVVGIATVVLIIGLLLFIYRSPVAAFLPILTVGLVSAIAPGLIALAAKAFGLQVTQDLQTILTVVLYGVGTDYILFLLFRYRERLRAGEQPKEALVSATARVSEVIVSAAGAIVVAFSALLLAVFGGFKSLGPGLAIAVAVMAFAAITLIPAVVSLLGPKVFWPSKSWQKTPKGAMFKRFGRFTARRPAVVALISGGLMVALALGALGMKVDYDAFSQLPKDTESARAVKDLQAGFPAGALNPTTVYLRSTDGTPLNPAELQSYAGKLAKVDGVGSVLPAAPDGSLALLNPDKTVAQINVVLADPPYAKSALDLVDGALRDTAHAEAPAGTSALLGGVSASYTDIRDANSRDLSVIFPVAGGLIAIILALLLRSLLAPLLLMVAVVLSFFSTTGATVLVFQGAAGHPGVTFSLPIMLYLFVVAIGTDYNILMIARLREEAERGTSPREAADLAIEHGGPSVAAAGLILAGTFSSLMLAGMALLTEMGFSVAAGIAISAFVMSIFLVPSVIALLGPRAWWPRKLKLQAAPEAEEKELEPLAR
ncbi:RND superfamily putative drug exporter [Kribbella orskensis]|uniref:RND superfamily putative drug exporter n=1 Tax=Kribbella orskensis TaxID=2512216 RepID=A0ABY2BAU7_9ACTN|nr:MULTISPECIES: MMPL family transporter [Kribbella]TCN33579.1 RND superfamily putative drug exporter [Kribbella sp. VKM Ac-2500]TCO14014.1 RND superfamily putative drug exporter [Kribbella orskensis]